MAKIPWLREDEDVYQILDLEDSPARKAWNNYGLLIVFSASWVGFIYAALLPHPAWLVPFLFIVDIVSALI
mgnify:CR=1 FL=1